MTSSRFLLPIALICSSLAFAQANQESISRSDHAATPTDSQSATVVPEPWKILSDNATDANVPQDPEARLEASADGKLNLHSELFLPPHNVLRGFVIPPFATADNTCFAIRSYVVARDSKNSDSTHPVGYTSCVPAAKYRIRKVDDTGNPGSAQLSK
jgi:hypothetical protein